MFFGMTFKEETIETRVSGTAQELQVKYPQFHTINAALNVLGSTEILRRVNMIAREGVVMRARTEAYRNAR